MSKIGSKPISIPDGVKIEIKNRFLEVKGSKGLLKTQIPMGVTTKVNNGELLIDRTGDEKKLKALHGLTRSLVSNMVQGVTEGFTKTLEILGIGYRAESLGKDVIRLNLGYSNPIEFSLPEGIDVAIEERGTKIIIHGIDNQLVGETAARIKKLRPPDAYKGKGIRYLGERLKLKPGKAGAKKE